MSSGWVYLHRQSLDSVAFSDAWLRHLWCWCLLKANHEPNPWQGRVIPRGSFATGRASAAEQLGVPESKFRRRMQRLEHLEMINTEATNRYTIIRIGKYDTYQREKLAKGKRPTNSQPTAEKQKHGENESVFKSADQQKPAVSPGKNRRLFDAEDATPTTHRPSNGHPATTNNNEDNGTKGKRFLYSKDFETFWSAFPAARKTGKRASFASWKKSIANTDAQAIIDAAAEYAASGVGRGEFVKGPLPSLNQGCWEDERAAWQKVDHLADEAFEHLATRLVVSEPNRLAAYKIETDVIENLKRLNTLIRRIARLVLIEERKSNGEEQRVMKPKPDDPAPPI